MGCRPASTDILLGTHSKWAEVDHARWVGSATQMTGEHANGRSGAA